ncbi:MAG: hypothetical protein ACREEM_53125 [Blastocatellia bacterium]
MTVLKSNVAKDSINLKDQVSGLEQLLITYRYHLLSTGEAHKALEAAQLMKQTAPDDSAGAMNLALVHNLLGQSEQAIAEAREVLRMSPRFAPAYWNLGAALLRANRFAEAGDQGQRAFAQGLDPANLRAVLAQVAWVEGDTAAWRQQLDWFKGRPEEYLAFDLQASAAAAAGRWREAQQWSRQAIELSGQDSTPDLPARYAAEQAFRGAALGDCRQAQADAAHALQRMRGRASLPRAALALALCKEARQAQSLTDELSQRYVQDSLTHSLWLPTIRAASELQRGNGWHALEQLQATSRYDAAAEFWPQYLRGQAYLQLKQGAAAAAEFQKILDHRGYAPLSPLYPLAHLGLARAAAAILGQTARERSSASPFFGEDQFAGTRPLSSPGDFNSDSILAFCSLE